MVQYCLQVIVFQLLFLVAYELFHKKDTFFTINRIYLLLSSVLSLVLPFMQFSAIQKTIPDEYIINLPTVFIGENLVNDQMVQTAEIGLNNSFSINWWFTIYSIGIVVSMLLFIKKIMTIRSLHKASIKNNIHGYPIRILLHSKDAFTFWNTIYIGEQLSSTEKKQILLHEITHLQQKHSLDLIWFEILKTIFWFNPMIYVYYSKMITLHEYISDASAIKLLGKQLYYEQLLNTTFQTNNIKFVNNFFNQKLLKKRIMMLQKTKSKAKEKLKYLAVIPLLLCMIVFSAFSQKAEDTESVTQILDVAPKEIKVEEPIITAQNIIPKKIKDKETDEVIPSIISEHVETVKTIVSSKEKDIPFAEVEQLPKSESCKGLTDQEEIKRCFSEEIKQFVNKNFDIGVAKSSGLTGVNRIYVRFVIDISGNIVDIQSRGPIPALEKEAKRVIGLLPKVIPGEHKGEKVNVLYALPIVFNIESTSDKNTQQKTIGNNDDQEESILTDNLSSVEGNTIANGYYLVANIFKKKSYFNKRMTELKNEGLDPKFFRNPKDTYRYIYLEKYNTLEEANKMLHSDFNGRYSGDMYILKIQ